MSLGELVTDRAAWLAERQQGVGASEAAAALGLSPFESPRELYLRKIGAIPPIEESEAMRWGTLLEPVIAAEYQRRTGREIARQQVFLRSELTPLMATIDGITADGMPVEFKAVGQWSGRELGEEETDELPDHWLIQGHQQMLLANAYRMQFAVLVGGQRLRIFDVARNEDLVERVIVGVRAFWECVQKRQAPASDLRADAKIMHLLYPGCEGEIELTEADQEIADEYAALGEDAKDANELREMARVRLLERLGEAAAGRLPDGRVIRRKVVKIAAHTVQRSESSYTRMWIAKGERK